MAEKLARIVNGSIRIGPDKEGMDFSNIYEISDRSNSSLENIVEKINAAHEALSNARVRDVLDRVLTVVDFGRVNPGANLSAREAAYIVNRVQKIAEEYR